MYSIEVDFDVYKQLTVRRVNEEMTYNDVVRELLGLGVVKTTVVDGAPPRNSEADWVIKNMRLPAGTECRATYKGQRFLAHVESAALVLPDGTRHKSPSSAAQAITKTSVNGWIFWECKLPGKSQWQRLSTLKENKGL